VRPPADAAPVEETVRAAALDPEPADIGNWGTATADSEPQFSMELSFDAHDDSDYLSADPALHDEVERKFVVLHLVGTQGELRGPAIEKACHSVHLRLGEMSIYHHHDGASGKVLFSVASMVEPGSFPVEEMDTFSTPGLTLFTQLPGARDGLEIYETMLKTGRQLAGLLRAELQDEHRNKLTGQMERHIAESIIEHRHRLKLARSRH
jgi:cell division protein ZipA